MAQYSSPQVLTFIKTDVRGLNFIAFYGDITEIFVEKANISAYYEKKYVELRAKSILERKRFNGKITATGAKTAS